MRLLYSTLLGLSLSVASPANAKDAPSDIIYTFGIVPQQSASRLAAMWGPFLNELSLRTNVKFQFQTTKDIPTFEACLASGAYDFAYMNPMHYAIFSQDASYRAIARQSDKMLKGLIVARTDSNFQAIADLEAEVIAFPSPGAFGASILTRSELKSKGVSYEPVYVSSHDSVYRAVASGLMAAGGGVTRTFNAIDPEIREQLSIIYETGGFTPHAIAISNKEGQLIEDLVQHALLGIAAENPDLIDGIGMRGFEIAQDSDWDDVRMLGMTREETGILDQGDVLCPLD